MLKHDNWFLASHEIGHTGAGRLHERRVGKTRRVSSRSRLCAKSRDTACSSMPGL